METRDVNDGALRRGQSASKGTTIVQMMRQVSSSLCSAFCCFGMASAGYLTVAPTTSAGVRVVVEVIRSDQAGEHIGETKTVCGLVASTRYLEGERDNPTFLNFDRPYPDQTMSIRIPGSHRAEFASPPEVAYEGKVICVTGLIMNFHGKPQIVVEDPSQIVIQAAESAPSPAIGAIASPSQKPEVAPPPKPELPRISSAQAREYLGQTVTVCGVIAGAKYVESQAGGRSFMSFDRPDPDQTLSVMIAGANRTKFQSAPAKLFNGTTVCVTGSIIDYGEDWNSWWRSPRRLRLSPRRLRATRISRDRCVCVVQTARNWRT
jgi:DNA/RNA endonuclease YhcR with UshA esterase domain